MNQAGEGQINTIFPGFNRAIRIDFYYQAGSWDRPRRVICMIEWHVHVATSFPLADHYQEVFNSG